MEFKKKLKVRLYYGIGCAVLGIVMMIFGFWRAEEYVSSLGLMFLIIGIARVIQYRRITQTEESLHQREIAEKDERNVLLWTKARSLTFTIYSIVLALVVIILQLMEIEL
ncbi:MAG: hypothetical protein J6A26_03925, partial [Oscillospiraceae bacterium]|nr:hypothetical protein [Oscillospiraceae bacterium]